MGAISGLAGLFFLGCRCAASSTPIDHQIEVPGTFATGTLPLGPLWVSDVPGLVLGHPLGCWGSKPGCSVYFETALVEAKSWLTRSMQSAPSVVLVIFHPAPVLRQASHIGPRSLVALAAWKYSKGSPCDAGNACTVHRTLNVEVVTPLQRPRLSSHAKPFGFVLSTVEPRQPELWFSGP